MDYLNLPAGAIYHNPFSETAVVIGGFDIRYVVYARSNLDDSSERGIFILMGKKLWNDARKGYKPPVKDTFPRVKQHLEFARRDITAYLNGSFCGYTSTTLRELQIEPQVVLDTIDCVVKQMETQFTL